MSKYWTNTTFGQVTELQQGMCFNKKNNHLLREDGIPVLLIKDLKNNTISQYTDTELTPKRFISKDTDIIYTRTGQVGLVFTNKIGVIHNNSFKISPNKDVYPLFLYWYLKQPSMIKYANNIAGGSAQPDLGHDAFKSMSFKYPDLETQKKIASVLSTYDNLIENNTRRIEVLEEVAQRIYKEWFVDFKYPGHENNGMIDSELGMIPEGWCVNKIGDLLSLEYGKSLTKNKRINGDVPVFGSSGIVGYHNVFLAKGPCVIVGRAGNAGDVHFTLDDFYPVDSTFYINRLNKDLSQYYLFYLFNKLNLKSIVSGSAVPGINRNHIYLLQVPIPTLDLLNKFNKIIIPIFKMINIIKNLNQNLTKTRDYLLPKLISGKVDVSDLDIDTSILDD